MFELSFFFCITKKKAVNFDIQNFYSNILNFRLFLEKSLIFRSAIFYDVINTKHLRRLYSLQYVWIENARLRESREGVAKTPRLPGQTCYKKQLGQTKVRIVCIQRVILDPPAIPPGSSPKRRQFDTLLVRHGASPTIAFRSGLKHLRTTAFKLIFGLRHHQVWEICVIGLMPCQTKNLSDQRSFGP